MYVLQGYTVSCWKLYCLKCIFKHNNEISSLLEMFEYYRVNLKQTIIIVKQTFKTSGIINL